MRTIGAIAFFVVAIGLAGWWQVYRWSDCRHVGHTKLYCVLTAG